MNVLAKFRVDSVTDFGGDSKSVKLSAVTSGSEENKAFWKWTPTGSIEMTINNPPAANAFKPGKEVLVEFQFPDEAV